MTDITKRDYLKLTAASLGVFTLGTAGLVATNNSGGTKAGSVGGGALAGENNGFAGGAGDVTGDGTDPTQPLHGGRSGQELDYERDDDGDIEFDWYGVSFQDGVEFETRGGDRDIEFIVSMHGVELEFETDNDGDEVEFTLEIGDEAIDFEYDANGRGGLGEVEFKAEGSTRKFENEDGEVEYKGEHIHFEWEEDDEEIDLKGEVMFDFDRDELEYRGTGIHIQWRRARPGRPADFEARLL